MTRSLTNEPIKGSIIIHFPKTYIYSAAAIYLNPLYYYHRCTSLWRSHQTSPVFQQSKTQPSHSQQYIHFFSRAQSLLPWQNGDNGKREIGSRCRFTFLLCRGGIEAWVGVWGKLFSCLDLRLFDTIRNGLVVNLDSPTFILCKNQIAP